MSSSLYYCSLVCVVFSVILGVSASDLVLLWFSFELNMMAFSFFMWYGLTNKLNLAKYFVAQSSGSLLLIFSVMALAKSGGSLQESLLVLSLVIKAGMPPAHSWLISLFSDLDKVSMWVLSCVQKLLPLYLLLKVSGGLLTLVAVSAVTVGSLGLLQQVLLKKLLAYSSLVFSAWGLSCYPSYDLVLIFSLSYGLSLGLIFMVNPGVKELSSKTWMRVGSLYVFCFSFLGILSLSGFPPTVGFMGKLIILQAVWSSSLVTTLALIASAPVALFSYCQFIVPAFSFGASSSGTLKGKPAEISPLLRCLALVVGSGGLLWLFFS